MAYFGGQMMGMGPTTGYAMPQERRPIKNILTDAEIDELRQKVENFNLGLTETEQKIARCNHRDKNGEMALSAQADGLNVCTICGEVIEDKMYTPEDVQAAVNEVNNIINIIKLIYGEMPRGAASEYYLIQPLLKKLPKLYELANNNMNKYDNINNLNTHQYSNMFAMYNSMSTGGMGMVNPGMAQPMGQPMMGGAAPVNNGGMMTPDEYAAAYYRQQEQRMAASANGVSNGFGVGGPALNGTYQAEHNNYQYKPGEGIKPQEVHVDTTLKA